MSLMMPVCRTPTRLITDVSQSGGRVFVHTLQGFPRCIGTRPLTQLSGIHTERQKRCVLRQASQRTQQFSESTVGISAFRCCGTHIKRKKLSRVDPTLLSIVSHRPCGHINKFKFLTVILKFGEQQLIYRSLDEYITSWILIIFNRLTANHS